MIDTLGELKLHSSRMTWLKISFQVVQGVARKGMPLDRLFVGSEVLHDAHVLGWSIIITSWLLFSFWAVFIYDPPG
jgi:hypothetical protein